MTVNISLSKAYEGISLFYLRYDVLSAKHTVVQDNLLMIPAKNDFRAENFSILTLQGVIPAQTGESLEKLEQRLREAAIKTALKNHGLKSLKTKDHETVISYEGMIKTPLSITQKSFNKERNLYQYQAQIEFAPIAFPDKWPENKLKHKIKSLFYDVFNLFR